MTDLSRVCYKNSFLKQVIVRIDFLQFVPTTGLFNSAIEEVILKIFPKRGKDQIIRFNEVNVFFTPDDRSTPNAKGTTTEGIKKEYFTLDGTDKIALTNKSMVFEINAYQSYQLHRQWLQNIIFTFCEINRITSVRTGIRFINIFEASRIKLQKQYFSNEIAATLMIKPNQEKDALSLVRSMHINEYRCDSMSLNFRYGMYNPDYPNILKNNTFALDYDCYTEEPKETADDILRTIEKGHDLIQQMFEKSITDALRKVMKDE